jgi:hypothetical protein
VAVLRVVEVECMRHPIGSDLGHKRNAHRFDRPFGFKPGPCGVEAF